MTSGLFLRGSLVPNFRIPIVGRTVAERAGSGKHEIKHDNGIIHVLGHPDISYGVPCIHVTAAEIGTLERFLRHLTVPQLVANEESFQSGPGKWLGFIQERMNHPIIDLSENAGWNLASWHDNYLGLELRFITGDFIPGGLEFAKAWGEFRHQPSYCKSTHTPTDIMRNFYGRAATLARNFSG